MESRPVGPSLVALFGAFLRLGCTAFGGPAMVAYIRRLAVDRKDWIHADDFPQGVALCQVLPGATAMQCAAWVGWRTRGLRGAVASYLGFGLPAFALMFGLAAVYQHAIAIDAVSGAMVELRALVVALVANSAWTMGRPIIRGYRELALALLTAALYLAGANPFVIIVGAGAFGAAALRSRTETRPVEAPRRGWRIGQAPLTVMAAAAVMIAVIFVVSRPLAALALLMMKIDFFAFGGGFASVPLMLHEVVDVRQWLPVTTFMDGIVLGQITPGPIVITATFVGYQVLGPAGAVVATLAIFLPSLFAVVLVEPWFRRLQSSPAFRGTTRALVLSFAGLLLSVTVSFARAVPWTVPAVVLTAAAMIALVCKVEVLWVVLGGILVSVVLR
jgi:chromate transporter